MENLTIRQINIIRLLDEDGAYLSSSILAERLNVSSRTIKNDIKSIMQTSQKYGYEIQSVSGKGYCIQKINFGKFEEFLENIEKSKDLNVQNNRIQFIIQKLLFSKEYIPIEKLSYEMFVSLTTLRNDIKVVKKVLEEDDLKLEAKTNKGVKVIGKETNFRKALSKYLKLDLSSIESYNRFFISGKLFYEDIRLLTDELVNILGDYDQYFMGIGITNILIHIIIAINRIKNGFKIEWNEILNLKNSKEREIAGRISTAISNKLNIKFSESEIEYLGYCLIGKGIYSDNNFAVKKFIDKIYEIIEQLFMIKFNRHSKYSKTLYYHTMGLLDRTKDRAKYNAKIDDQVAQNVKHQFVLPHEFALIYKQEFLNVFGIVLDKIEISYITIHFAAMLENIKLEKKLLSIMIITETRPSNAMLMKNEMLLRFQSKIGVIDIFSPYEIKKNILSRYDAIFATCKVREINKDIHLFISDTLNETDMLKIENYLFKKKELLELFNQNLFFNNLDFKRYDRALHFLTSKFESFGYIHKGDDFYKDTIKREELQSTRFDYIFAFPHPIQPQAKKNFISIGIAPKGITWIDGGIVKLILYVGLKEQNKHEFQDVFNILSKITSNRLLVDQLVLSQNSEKFTQILLKQLSLDKF